MILSLLCITYFNAPSSRIVYQARHAKNVGLLLAYFFILMGKCFQKLCRSVMYTCYFKYTNQIHKIRQLYYGICLLDHLNRMTIHILSGLFICVYWEFPCDMIVDLPCFNRYNHIAKIEVQCNPCMIPFLMKHKYCLLATPFEESRNTGFTWS